MKHVSLALALMLLCIALPCAALCEELFALAPIPMTPEAEAQTLDLYCGPTQGFYRHGEQTLDIGKDYVVFGQYDCWAMAAQGTPESFGPVGWVEAGSLADLAYEPQLGFDDSFAAMIEETAPLTNDPLSHASDTVWTASLERGTQVIVLAQYGDWLYVQAEIEDTPVRAFVPASSI